MNFGYFTLSDNRYPGNPRTPEQFVKEIYEQCLWADKIGLHSAWVGEHHFNLLGVNAAPHVLLAQLAGATQRIRLAPAVVVLPVHHPLLVAEEWATLDLLSGGRVDFAAGRGYDAKEYEPLGASLDDSLEIFEEGMDILWRAWTSEKPFSHHGKWYRFDDVDVRPKPHQQPLRPFVASFSPPSMEMAAKNDWNIIYAPFAAAMMYGSLADAVKRYQDRCAAYDNPPRRANCSYFIHLCDTPADERYAKEGMISYFQEALVDSFPSDPKTAPPTLRYFVEIVDMLNHMDTNKLSTKSVLIGSKDHIISALKEVEAAGISEVILYFNVGRKPHAMVIEQMQRFMEEIAPEFGGAHRQPAAANPGL